MLARKLPALTVTRLTRSNSIPPFNPPDRGLTGAIASRKIMTNKSKVESALRNKNLRHLVNAIDSNGYATPGEVVLWINGMGHPVYSVKEATTLVQRIADADDLCNE